MKKLHLDFDLPLNILPIATTYLYPKKIDIYQQ